MNGNNEVKAQSSFAIREDLVTLQRLEEFAAEIATLRGRVDALEARTAELEANQYQGSGTDIWNWTVTLAFPDLGRQGNLAGFVVGMPPKVTNNDIGDRTNTGTSYHLEGFYRYQLTNNVDITPGVFVILNPEHNNDNNAIWVGTLRTTFRF